MVGGYTSTPSLGQGAPPTCLVPTGCSPSPDRGCAVPSAWGCMLLAPRLPGVGFPLVTRVNYTYGVVVSEFRPHLLSSLQHERRTAPLHVPGNDRATAPERIRGAAVVTKRDQEQNTPDISLFRLKCPRVFHWVLSA
ncbi:unnamed protein product [Lota lota]